ncbi:MAG: membrane protein insertase YidC [Bacteroidales bacterium]|nr:membrane protein insertase YidC [Bacteroidales bacterium]
MDKNTITGFVLIAIIVFAFSYLNQPSKDQIEKQRLYQDSIAQVLKAQENEAAKSIKNEVSAQNQTFESDSAKTAFLNSQFGVFANAVNGESKVVSLDNEFLSLKFNTKGGILEEAVLKDYKTYKDDQVVLFNKEDDNYGFSFVTADQKVVNTADLYFTPSVSQNEVSMKIDFGANQYLEFVYTIEPESYLVNFDIRQNGLSSILSPSSTYINMFWEQKLRSQEKGRVFEERYSNLYYKYIADDVDYLSATNDESKTLNNKVRWIGYKNQFFTSALISKNGFNGATLNSQVIKEDPTYIKNFRSETDIDLNLKDNVSASFDFYLGPNSYPLLKKVDSKFDEDLQLDKLVPLGVSVFRWVNVYLVIPVFNFLGKYIANYGIIILLLTIFIKIILAPFTYKSYLSQAKMRVLRPEINEINEKYQGKEKAMERQQATMKLYSQAGINPMGGCLPTLLQMPILFAMFQFFPSSIELRGESFLWVKDLSTYDAIYSWNTYIPLITPYFGNHISLFCLLMTVTNIISTKLSMSTNPGGQEQMPGMKTMMYMMPLMFLFFFNNYAAGLSYYYFISTLITIGQTYAFRLFINEDKLLAQLKANAKKPKKKSGFMARLEEAQKMQQEALKKQQNQKKR